MFSSSEPVAARSDCSRHENALCLCSPVQPAQAVQESGPKSFAKLFGLDYLQQPSERLPDDQQGLKLGLKLGLCHLTNELYRFYRLQYHSINSFQVEFEFIFCPLLMPNLSQMK